MLVEKLQDAINEQINKELYSEYFYLSMAAWFEAMNLPGFANFFVVQAQEERFHVMKFWRYLNDRGGRVILKQIDQPKVDFSSAEEIFELAYKHEQFVTKSINELMDLAIEQSDHATRSMLNWFIDEQVEEEASMDGILQKLKLVDGRGHGMLMLDKELAARTFTPPTSN
ncbi:MAG: ferritin [Candidatus Cloacimonetes bacterium]|nr:ferritin [Candidatus Cloacimonadota bacterium]